MVWIEDLFRNVHHIKRLIETFAMQRTPFLVSNFQTYFMNNTIFTLIGKLEWMKLIHISKC